MFWHRKPKVRTWTSISGADLIDPDFRALTRWEDYTAPHKRYSAVLGWQPNGDPAFIDFATAPHVLIAGATGSGKSVGVNTIIASLLVKNTPASLKMYIIDPKMVDYMHFRRLPHVAGYCINMQESVNMMNIVHSEMMRRYAEMQRQGISYTTNPQHILIVFDEFASLMNKEGKKRLLPLLQEVARLGRAAGVHLLLATQRPTRDVIDGQLKANCPARIAYRVSSATDSRVILDSKGAEQLAGMGDGIYLSSSGEMIRFQGHMTSPAQLDQIMNHWARATA